MALRQERFSLGISRSHLPNILLVMTDYQRGVDGPSLGSPFLDMPALDRLCREGAVFKRHYTTSPICMPARYTVITGQYPHTHGQHENWQRWLPTASPILMELLRAQGYNTVGVGKMHFFPWDRMAGFDRRIIADCKEAEQRPDDYARFLDGRGLSRREYLTLARESDIPNVYDWPFDECCHIDAYVGAQARRVIERDELTSPWFMWVSFNGPHNPWDPPAAYSDPYKAMDLPPAITFPGELATKPREHRRLRYNYGRALVDLIDRDPEHREEIIHRVRAGYYGNLTLIDRQLEGILYALEKKNALDDTIVIYTSDHGCAIGDHNLIHKGLHYDCDARVPFVVRYPPFVEPRQVDGFSSHVDFLPTVLSIVGAPVPEEVEGKDFVPLLTGTAEAIQDYVVLECRFNTSIVTDQWKMGIYHFDREGDLYDLQADPDELHNLFGRPEVAQVQAQLTAELLEWRQCLDPEAGRALADRQGIDRRFGL